MSELVLRLYIAGRTPAAERAIRNLESLLSEAYGEAASYSVEVIDILERPQLAEDERILATPVVVKKLPPPVRRVVGDLSERERVLIGLDIKEN
ncbi:circadian clock protein KaiB [Halorhodospira halochloris]|uniref:Circadian oscillation regulator KaiB n=1 Tax=Halorhodospira halochloris TaxID=1052 RepID=A0A110B4J2_HALHR|nr:circadian clock KaiB family protein [Halorhodospira halochloris]MBK1652300.1 circadian clock protein KaiB [Halorhodospira halochloris]MCG5529719.1 circadian clock protein KaiB [Halorhodospira halochloris]MCG5548373.1 circadian clock protein KaiB [Halorhodospira halochloris]BAU56903.1 circadian oscillation regulator KaiB [Halorhodospira halochloris]